MLLCGKRIGFGITGSHCTVPEVLSQMERMVAEGATVFPVLSFSVDSTDTRFGKAAEIRNRLAELTGNTPVTTILEAEPIGPEKRFDVFVVAPCTGNTLGKLANAITDTPVLMAAKAHLRNQRPVVIGISTNDALGLNARNLGVLLAAKNVFFVPFGQDNPQEKPNSLVAKMDLLVPTVLSALEGKQLQPLLLGPAR